MKLLFTLFKIIVINLLVIVGLLLVTMLPRETNQVELNEFKVKYIFSVQAYFTNISEFIKDRASTLSWGETWSSQTSVFQEMIHYFAKSSLVLLFSLLIALVLGFGIGMIIHAFGRKLKRGDTHIG